MRSPSQANGTHPRPDACVPLLQARRDSNPQPPVLETGALPIELRTSKQPSSRLVDRDTWPGAESNCRHHDFQSCALPTELPGRRKKPARSLSGRGRGVSSESADPTGSPLPPASAGSTCQRPSRKVRTCFTELLRVASTWETPPLRRRFRTSSGGGIRTRDLRVMSPTSYQTAPPRNRAQSIPTGLRGGQPLGGLFRRPLRNIPFRRNR